MLTELGLQRTESMVLQYSTKHEPYEARIVLGRVYEGCPGWEQKFPSRPTFGHGTPLLLELKELHVLGPDLCILGMVLLCQVPHLGLRDLLRRHGTR